MGKKRGRLTRSEADQIRLEEILKGMEINALMQTKGVLQEVLTVSQMTELNKMLLFYKVDDELEFVCALIRFALTGKGMSMRNGIIQAHFNQMTDEIKRLQTVNWLQAKAEGTPQKATPEALEEIEQIMNNI